MLVAAGSNSPLSPRNERGGAGGGGLRRTQSDACRSGIECSPLGEERAGRGRGWGTPSDAARCLSQRDRTLPSPLSPRNEGGGAGGGGLRRTQPDACRSATEFSPLREERAGRGRGRGTPRTQFDPRSSSLRPPTRAAGVAVCVRDARPQGRDTGAHAPALRNRLDARERWWLGALRHSCIVPWCARSPARSAAEGHAQNVQLQYRKSSAAHLHF